MEIETRNKWVVILGGSSGIGWATAQKLGRRGYHLFVVYRERKGVERAWREQWEELLGEMSGKGIAINEDALQKRDQLIAQLTEAMGEGEGVYLLLHCISKGNLKQFKNGVLPGEKDFQITHDAMVWSLWYWCRDLREKACFLGGARIIGLTSRGSQRVWEHYGIVGMAKSALEALIRQLAAEWGGEGFRINAIEAGIIDSPSMRKIPGSKELKKAAEERNPSGRMTRASDVANVIALMLMDEASWINGAILPVDGGERWVL